MNFTDIKKLSDKKFFDSLSVEDLTKYAELIRRYLIETCSKKSTHLASNLGTIEIFLALNKVFDFSKDLFTFDVGHQIYTYKILTGRFDRFSSLREFGGISGFPDPEESGYDLFRVGHVGCGLPLALGLSAAKNNTKSQIITLLGDGALTNGAMLEALNFISNRPNGKIIIILNDNGMSISKTVPTISKKLSLFATKLNIRGTLEKKLKKSKHSLLIGRLVVLFKSLKAFILPRQIFEDFGIRYVGPIDGHNIKELIEYFTFAKNFPQTILIHVKTIKGKGFKPAEDNPELFHSAPPYNPLTGEVKKSSISFTNIFGKILVDKAEKNENIFAITAAMKSGCGLDDFEKKFPERFIDVGIAESLAVSMGAGLAKSGKNPVVAIYSIFLQRAAAQIYHDVVINHLPVFFAIDRFGLVGIDGPTHHGLNMYPFLSSLADIYLFNCGLIEDIESSFNLLGKVKLPVFIQYPKDVAISFNDIIKQISNFMNIELKSSYNNHGVTEIYAQSDTKNIAIICVGSGISIGKNAFINLIKENIFIDFYYISLIKPFPYEDSEKLISKYKNIIVVDEAPANSYVFERFAEISAKLKLKNNTSSIIFPFTLPDIIITHGTREQLFDYVGFSEKKLVELVKEIIEKNS